VGPFCWANFEKEDGLGYTQILLPLETRNTDTMSHEQKCYVTTPIYYVTAKPHLGSLYSTLLADVIARWNKIKGKRVFFLTGTDEHGQKIAEAALKAGMKPKEFVDQFIADYEDTWHAYNIHYNRFIRTTDQDHIKAVQTWLQDLLNKGDIYKSFYTGWYCTPCETFVTEKEAEHKNQAPLCPSCGRETISVSEETYFFKLSAYQDKLLNFYKKNPDFIVPKERAHEVINFVKSGLKDLSISRTTVKWGIPFPNDETHVAYVWADALNNYITAIGYGQKNKEKEFKQWWPADVQVLGKDIIRFHAIYWPAFLMASDLPLPKQLLVHGWINVDNRKMSKSFGNVVDPMDLLHLYGADSVRYYLLKQMAITQDGNFSTQDLEEKISTDLANDLGNLLNRMVSLAYKHKITTIEPPAAWHQDALDLIDDCYSMLDDVHEYMDEFLFHMALARVWQFISKINSYFHAQEPWKLAKSDTDRFKEVLSATAHGLHVIGLILWPAMPDKMAELLTSLGETLSVEPGTNLLERTELDRWGRTFMLKKIDTLFKKVEPQENAEKPAEEQKSEYIGIEDFEKVEMVVGTIEQCEEIPKSDRLLKLQVNFGNKIGMRQILSGIKQWYSASDLIGKQAIFVINLKPRKMMGIESQGMLMATGGDKPVIATVAYQVPNGVRLK